MPGVYTSLPTPQSNCSVRIARKPRFARQYIFAPPPTSARIPSMKRRALLQSLPAAALLPAAAWASSTGDEPGPGAASTAIYELRVYHTFEGKLEDLLR